MKKRPSSPSLSRGKTRHSRLMRKRNSGVRKAATVGRGRRGWRMNAWPKATKSKSCRQKTRLSPRTCTCPIGSRSEEGRQEVILDNEASKNNEAVALPSLCTGGAGIRRGPRRRHRRAGRLDVVPQRCDFEWRAWAAGYAGLAASTGDGSGAWINSRSALAIGDNFILP